ncbi:hypothetical protein CPB83DRAFT_83210 [Crepidotus variabilis]|uniref:Uncharacterized protein n=1 Tax=Crepidotus variabilis TaxID=179855 RepID=A0A9P6JS94_9AGAR|nr:hypothetical protein CPB83DRAFT_83210 [Crepidotus variabilis]
MNLATLSNHNRINEILDPVRTTFNNYELLVQRDTALFKVYHGLMIGAVYCSDDSNVTVALSVDVVERLRTLSQVHPKIVGPRLLGSLWYHGRLLASFDRLKEAANWLESHGNKYSELVTADVEIGQWYIHLLLNLAEVLKDQGDLDRAKAILRRAAETGRSFSGAVNYNTAFLMCVAVSHEAGIENCLGDNTSALKLCKQSLSSARSNLRNTSIALFQLQHSKLLTADEEHGEALLEARESGNIITNASTTSCSRSINISPFGHPSFYEPGHHVLQMKRTLLKHLKLQNKVRKKPSESKG